MLSQILLSQISMLMQIFITVKESNLLKGSSTMDSTIWTSKETNQRYLVFGISHWDPHRHSEFVFFPNLWKILVKEMSFGQCYKLYACSFTKKEFLLRHFSKILPVDSVGKIITEQQVSIITLPVASSVYASNSVNWEFYKWRVTNPCNKIKFSATLAVGWKLVAKYRFFRSSLK